MPAYDFYCPECRKTVELVMPAARRNDQRRCAKGHVMKRRVSAPLAVNWEGKFQGRWNKQETGEW